jgi:hypothetical protein
MHPLVRDLYKRVIHVGRDYPLGLEYVREKWKPAIQNKMNCPLCYPSNNNSSHSADCEREIRLAVGKGRHMVREMIGVIQLKKYRAMKRRYDSRTDDDITAAMKRLEK